MSGSNIDTFLQEDSESTSQITDSFFFPPSGRRRHRPAATTTAAATTTKAGLLPTTLRLPEFFYVFALYIFSSGTQDLFVELFFPVKCPT